MHPHICSNRPAVDLERRTSAAIDPIGPTASDRRKRCACEAVVCGSQVDTIFRLIPVKHVCMVDVSPTPARRPRAHLEAGGGLALEPEVDGERVVEELEGLGELASPDELVAAAELGIGLFDERDPELGVVFGFTSSLSSLE